MSGMTETYDDRLAAFVGRVLNEQTPGQDPVNVPMIRHWVEAMDLTNPVHLDADAARATGRDDVVAPASMVQAWTMRGYARTVRPVADTGAGAGAGFAELIALLDEGGYTSVVATDSEFEFVRELVPGDEITVEEVVDSISEEKTTGLGTGRFVTSVKTYRDAAGETVATQRWRTLRFKPKQAEATTDPAAEAPQQRALRPRPAINQDNAFWFEAANQKRLVVQRCTNCQALRHPPGPGCPECGSFDWDTVEAGNTGTVHSFTVAHHPKHPAFDYPLVIALIDLPTGTRLTSNLVGVAPEDVTIGMPVVLDWLEADDDLTLPVFRPETSASHTEQPASHTENEGQN